MALDAVEHNYEGRIMKPIYFFCRARAPIAILATALLLSAAADADDPSNDGQWWIAHPIEGVWNATVNLTTCGPTPITLLSFQSMGVFARGGTYHDTNSTSPALKSSTFGVWKHLGGRRYAFAFRFFRFDAAGTAVGTNIVRHEVVLSADRQSYTSSGTGEVYDLAGNLIASGCSSASATRFE